MRYRRVCLTGGAGFIGSHVARALLAGGVEVRILDNLSTGRRENVPPGAELIAGDILDPGAADRAVDGCDALLHLAARVAIRSSFEFAVEDTMANVVGTAAIIRAAIRAGSVRRIVTTSSMAVYADAPTAEPIDETHAVEPISPYGVSKLASERLTHTMARAAKLESAVLRLFNTYGPGQAFSPYVGVVTIFVNQLAAGEKVIIYGDGEQARDFVHVSDVARAFLLALGSDSSGETFNIGTGRATSVNRVYELIAAQLGTGQPAVHVDAVPGELRYSVADIAKARRLLGYSPSHSFEESIGEVVREILPAGSRE
ncbi:MAG: NAD-dependent epimerase/dehydratase family protein [Bryobacteraceae bacterium]|nr:NAD-dependent epimerase/dehydratase family protein [Bryobacteraceae bacterium]